MAAAYPLNSSLVEYTNATVLSAIEHKTELFAVARARAAVEFFVRNLDASIPEEKLQLEFYQQCLEDLSVDTKPSPPLSRGAQPTAATATDDQDPTPARQVLELPEIISLIVSKVPNSNKSGRKTLASIARTSRSLRYESQRRLWSIPCDLDTVENQIQFAFATAISRALGGAGGSLGPGLGSKVQRLAVRWLPNASNKRILCTIAKQCPNVQHVVVHWGDTEDKPDEITTQVVEALRDFLKQFQNLTSLELCKFSYTPDGEEDIPGLPQFDDILNQLIYLRLDGYTWNWLLPSLLTGLTNSTSLESLHIGFSSLISRSLSQFAKPSLTSLNLTVFVELSDVEAFAKQCQNLQSVRIQQFGESRDGFGRGAMEALSTLVHLSELWFDAEFSPEVLGYLTASPAPLSLVNLLLHLDVGGEIAVQGAMIDFILAKKATLESITFAIVDSSPEHLGVLDRTEAFITALSQCRLLEDVDITPLPFRGFESLEFRKSQSIDTLLTQCPNLCLTDTLQLLVEGNELYIHKYQERFEKERKKLEEEWEEEDYPVLGR